MYHWFTTYPERDWTPERGYNQLFAEQVRLTREWFRLKKTNVVGVEVTSGHWRQYELQDRLVFVSVDRFEWRHYTRRGGYPTPLFRLRIKIAGEIVVSEKPKGFLAMIFGGAQEEKRSIEVFFENTLVIEFPRSYPDEPPRFRIDDPHYDAESASHSHHMFSGGWFCILASSSDWNSSRDTVVSGLNAALDWIVWHHNKFGW